MVASALPVSLFTLFWLGVGAGVPWFVPKGDNRGMIQTMIGITAVLCYTFLALLLHVSDEPLGRTTTQERDSRRHTRRMVVAAGFQRRWPDDLNYWVGVLRWFCVLLVAFVHLVVRPAMVV
uniref:Putative proton-transporting v-type atpase n=1 Tax=Ixodes ricinus TaxID=34613 RepID=V5H0Z0_IXORI